MTILCGTDFTARASEAAEVAALLAAHQRQRLVLAHVVEHGGAEAADERLEVEVERLRALAPGLDATTRLEAGLPDEVLVALAGDPALDVQLVVVSSLGRRGLARCLIGSVAERTAQASPVPVLVVREVESWRAWLGGERPLRVLLGEDFSAAAAAALDWARWLAGVAPCELIVAHLIEEPVREDEGAAARRTQRLGEQIQERLAVHAWPGPPPRLRVEGGLARRPHALARMTTEECADLLLVGSRQLHGLGALWQESVSRGALVHATICTACVPAPAVAGRGGESSSRRSSTATPS